MLKRNAQYKRNFVNLYKLINERVYKLKRHTASSNFEIVAYIRFSFASPKVKLSLLTYNIMVNGNGILVQQKTTF